MVWIVPEPDPRLSLRVTDIDICTLTYDDITYISSSSMKKYYEEFMELEGFGAYMKYLIEVHTINVRLKELLPPSRYLNNGHL